jgi:hypothetical protein
MLPVAENVPVDGSYNSAVASPPPAISTMPLGRSIAEWNERGALILPVGVNVPVAESYTSAVAVEFPLLDPPATSTLPLLRSVAV